ncbi:hypothetical protein D3C75_261530 [compost metagenome]
MAALMDAQQQRVHHVEDDLFVIAFPQRIRPYRRLLRCQRGGRSGSDRSEVHIILLIARRLNAVAAQHRVVHPHSAAGAVLDDQLRIPGEDAVNPAEISPVMLKQTGAIAVSVRFRADACVDVVIHLDIADAVFVHQPVDNRIGMRDNRRIPEIELISAPVHHPPAVAHEEPAVVRVSQLRTVDAHNLDFQPKTGDETLAPDVIEHVFDPFREAFLGRQPLSYAVPPFSGSIPAGIDAEVFAADIRRGVNKRQQLLCCGVAPQTVHIVVEDNAQQAVVIIRSADYPPVSRQRSRRLPEAAHGRSYRYRHGDELFAGRQIEPPVIVMLRRSSGEQRQLIILVGQLPVPGAVVLDLPEQAGAMLLVGHDRHRHEFRCRPGAGIAGSDPFRAAVRQMGHAKLGQCVGLPLQLAGPAALAERHLHLLAAVACAFLVRACERKGRNILHAKRSFAAVSQGCPATDDRNTGKELDMLNRPKPGNRVFEGNFKLAAALAGRIAVSVIHHAQARI